MRKALHMMILMGLIIGVSFSVILIRPALRPVRMM